MIKLQANRLLASDLELQTSEYLIVNYLIGELNPNPSLQTQLLLIASSNFSPSRSKASTIILAWV